MKKPPIRFDKNIKDIPKKTLVGLYATMLRIRKVQLAIEKEYPKDEMKTPVHLCVGQEAIPSGVCTQLEKDDYVFSNYRGHGHYLAKGGDLKSLISELYCRETGCSKGRGGSMHLVDTSAGLLGTSSIVGGQIPIATGAALGSVMQRKKRVVVVFFGDGAVDEGVLYESINFAMLKRLPVIYACENNFYAVCSPQKKRQPLDNIYRRFNGCGIRGYRVDGNNVIDVYRRAQECILKARSKREPSFIEFRTYRWYGHSGPSDIGLGYRTQEELNGWMRRCPVENFEGFLLKEGIIDKAKKLSIEKRIEKEIEEAFNFAKTSPLPDGAKISEYLYYDEKDKSED